MFTGVAPRRLLAITVCLVCPASLQAWEYVLNPPMCPVQQAIDSSSFQTITVDSQGSVIACGPITLTYGPPSPLHVVKVTGSAGDKVWDFRMPSSNNWKAVSYCNGLTTGPGDKVYVAASTSIGPSYNMNFFNVTEILPDGSAGWEFSRGVLRDYARSTATTALRDPTGDVIAMGWIVQEDYSNGFVMIKLSAEGGAERWRRYISLQSASYAIDSTGDILADGIVFSDAARNSPRLIKLAGSDGHEIWRFGQTTHPMKALLTDESSNPIFSDGVMITKVASLSGTEIWRAPGSADSLLLEPSGDILAVSFPHAAVLSTATGQSVGEFDFVPPDSGSCSRFSMDGAGDVFGVCGGLELAKWSGKTGAILWSQPALGPAFVVDRFGDVTVAGVRVLSGEDACYGNLFRDSMAVLRKYWGKTGADFPPSSADRISYLRNALSEMVTNQGIAASLARKLDQAARLLSDSNPANDSSAANSLRAFVHEVMVLGGRQIAMEDSLALKSEAEKLIEALAATSAGVTPPPRSLNEDAAPVRQTPARQ